MPYKKLDSAKIERTIGILHGKIASSLGDRGLARVCGELHELSRKAEGEAVAIARRNWLVVGVAVVLSVVIVALIVWSMLHLKPINGPLVFSDYLQALESGINDLLLTGAAIWFLFTVENRLKRRRALNAIHELRAIAHIIDMHQLTKNPSWEGAGPGEQPAPEVGEDLHLYFQYCSAMLSLTGKVAALYVQKFNDSETLAAVNEVEELTTGLSRKIWQKMTVLQSGRGTANVVASVEPTIATAATQGDQAS
ncbi:MAG: hypothetical protein IPJ24_17320 [bacterium]|nr:hypothetical protein [bacterium]